jgi:deazaflavin-dependent oxidoreductase (nitroreductase family)
MPMPRWWAQLNKRLFNPRAVADDRWAVIRHVGRVSGAAYSTPVEAHRIPGGLAFLVIYGPRTDWLLNVLAAGGATVRLDGREVAVTRPRVVALSEVMHLMPAGTKPPPRFLGVTQCLVVDAVDADRAQ